MRLKNTMWLAALLACVTTATASAATINVSAGESIQAAIDAAVDGDVIEVLGSEYVIAEQLVIDKDITLQGQGKTLTTLKPGFDTPSGSYTVGRAFIYVDYDVTATIKDLAIDCAGNVVYDAIQSRGASLTVSSCDISNVRGAIYDGRPVLFLTGTGLVENCTISGFQRIGVHVRGGVEPVSPIVTVTGCTITGKGDGDWLDYAVEAGGGGVATVTDCVIENCRGVASSDGSTSAGLLATDFYGNGTKMTVTDCTITDNSAGIIVGYSEDDSTVVVAHNNSIAGNGEGINSIAAITVDATNNWWGDIDPSDDVSGAVDYSPWLGAAPGTVPMVIGTNDSIQAAIDAAAAGDTINIAAGTYNERPVINKSLTLIGADEDTVIIDAGAATSGTYGMSISADDVTVEELTLVGDTGMSTPRYGFKPSNVARLTLRNVTATEFYRSGVDLLGVDVATLENVSAIDNGGHGFAITDCNTVTITNATSTANGWSPFSMATWGSYSPIGLSGITFAGTLTYDGVFQFEMGDANNPGVAPAGDAIITYSTNPLDNADVTLPVSLGFMLHGIQDDAPGQVRVYPFETLADAATAAAIAPLGHMTAEGRFIEALNSDGQLYVVPGCSIQAAIDAAADGDTINVAAGTYVEQVVIDGKNVRLVGAGDDTIIQSPDNLVASFTTSAANYPVVYVTNADDVAIQNLVVDGAGKGNANYRFIGIGYYKAGGSVESVDVINVIDTPFSGAQHGTGIYLYNDDNVARSMTVSGCEVVDFQKTAIALNVSATTALAVLVEDNLIVGAGPTTVTAQNGIQVWGELVTGTIQNNNVSGIWYSGENWGASGLLSYFGGTLLIQDNTFTACQMVAIYGSDDSTITGNTITDGEWSLVLYQSDGITIDGNTITGGSTGVDVQESTNITVVNNDLSNNADGGVYVNDTSFVDASNNWWGDASGPLDESDDTATGGLYNPNGLGSPVTDYVDYEPWLTENPAVNILQLNVVGDPVYLKNVVDTEVVINMDALNLAQHVVACQAFLNFDSSFFKSAQGDVVIAAGGGVWDNPIWRQYTSAGDLDVAIGVNLTSPVGTKADGTVAKFTLKLTGTQGTTQVVFRSGGVGGLESTMFADFNAQDVAATTVDSQMIVIDGTLPTIAITSAMQDGSELIGSGVALRGDVTITVNAADALAGLAVAPTVVVGGDDVTTTAVDNNDGTFTYTYKVDGATPNGAMTITASAADKAGNEASAQAAFNVNKDEIVATVEIDTLSAAAYSFDRDVTFVAVDGADAVLATWTETVTMTNAAQIASGSVTLTNVPAGTVAVTADTAWTMVQKVEGVAVVNGGAAVDFTGAEKLRAGDLNGSNSVNVLDYAILKANWNSSNAVADMNGDGGVQTFDYSLLKMYWFQSGE